MRTCDFIMKQKKERKEIKICKTELFFRADNSVQESSTRTIGNAKAQKIFRRVGKIYAEKL